MNRRALLAGLALAPVAPCHALAAETHADRIDRLASELESACAAYRGGHWKLVVDLDNDFVMVTRRGA